MSPIKLDIKIEFQSIQYERFGKQADRKTKLMNGRFHKN